MSIREAVANIAFERDAPKGGEEGEEEERGRGRGRKGRGSHLKY